MKILHINDNDLIGRRFSGHDLQIMLNKKDGFSAKQMVVLKSGNDKNTFSIIKTVGSSFVKEKCKEFEEKISMQSVIYPFGEMLLDSDEFKEADIVHYHLIFNNFMSLYSFKKLALLKPTVWTLHDPWALTGHCVYPIDCKGWLTGCKNCPHLDRYFPLKEDNSSSIWNIKKDIYNDLDIDLVVASQWMYEMVKQSPLTKHSQKVHLIPYGIDTNLFKRKENRKEIRESLGIGDDNFVIMFREASEWKGGLYINEMLENLQPEIPVTILTVGEVGQLNGLKKKYKIIECGWVNDNDHMVDLYSSADLFLMPSTAEAFGLMAIEAMACSLPIIVFNGTSLPNVTFAPECGISLEKGDLKGFVKIVTGLLLSPKECESRGVKGRKIAEENYSLDKYHEQIINLYEEIYRRK